MARMLVWTVIGGVAGFAVFAVLFYAVAPHGPDRLLFVVFAAMAAIPVAVIGAILAAITILKDVLEEIRSELARLQRGRRDERAATASSSDPSMQFQAKRFDRGPG